jgi:hypothetical protein
MMIYVTLFLTIFFHMAEYDHSANGSTDYTDFDELHGLYFCHSGFIPGSKLIR